MKSVIVYWYDASSEGHNLSLEDIASLPECAAVTHGFLTYEDDKIIRVTQNSYQFGDAEAEFQGTMTIPRGCIQRIEEIKSIAG